MCRNMSTSASRRKGRSRQNECSTCERPRKRCICPNGFRTAKTRALVEFNKVLDAIRDSEKSLGGAIPQLSQPDASNSALGHLV